MSTAYALAVVIALTFEWGRLWNSKKRLSCGGHLESLADMVHPGGLGTGWVSPFSLGSL
jgi:hypothetical protein